VLPVSALHQLCAGFSKGDAISHEALTLRALFRSWGMESEIFSEPRWIHPALRGEARDAAALPALCRPDDIVLLHLSIGSPVNRLFGALTCRKAILYHNVTPPAYFEWVKPETARALAAGLEEARALAGAAEVNLADSRFNAAELEAAGYRNVRVLPLVLDRGRLAEPADPAVAAALSDGKRNVLFVGRIAPNKKIEDLLAAFAHFQQGWEPESRLILAGSWAGTERYHRLLSVQVRNLGLRDVTFRGTVPQAVLHGLYAAADLFLCLSEHEGFGIPLLEAMEFGVPVLAYAASAVPETMDGAGVLAARKDYPALAGLMAALCREAELRGRVLAGQRARMARYWARDLEAELRGHLAPLLGKGGAS
jgi:glycosyltransferase involved in cell wall biosynthesis